jgi:hypothetical protein
VPLIALPPLAPERRAAALSEPAAPARYGEPEPPASAAPELAPADPAAVPAGAHAKLVARTGEAEETAPIHRLMPRFVPHVAPRLPRIPALSRHSLLQPRLTPAPSRVTPTFARRVHAKAKRDAGKPDIAKAAAPRKPVRHAVHQVEHRAQRAYDAPDTAVSPTVVSPGYSVTSDVQYK